MSNQMLRSSLIWERTRGSYDPSSFSAENFLDPTTAAGVTLQATSEAKDYGHIVTMMKEYKMDYKRGGQYGQYKLWCSACKGGFEFRRYGVIENVRKCVCPFRHAPAPEVLGHPVYENVEDAYASVVRHLVLSCDTAICATQGSPPRDWGGTIIQRSGTVYPLYCRSVKGEYIVVAVKKRAKKGENKFLILDPPRNVAEVKARLFGRKEGLPAEVTSIPFFIAAPTHGPIGALHVLSAAVFDVEAQEDATQARALEEGALEEGVTAAATDTETGTKRSVDPSDAIQVDPGQVNAFPMQAQADVTQADDESNKVVAETDAQGLKAAVPEADAQGPDVSLFTCGCCGEDVREVFYFNCSVDEHPHCDFCMCFACIEQFKNTRPNDKGFGHIFMVRFVRKESNKCPSCRRPVTHFGPKNQVFGRMQFAKYFLYDRPVESELEMEENYPSFVQVEETCRSKASTWDAIIALEANLQEVHDKLMEITTRAVRKELKTQEADLKARIERLQKKLNRLDNAIPDFAKDKTARVPIPPPQPEVIEIDQEDGAEWYSTEESGSD